MQVQRVNMNSQSFGAIRFVPRDLKKALKMIDNSDFQTLIKMTKSNNKAESNAANMVFDWVNGIEKLKKNGYEITEELIDYTRKMAIKRLGKNGTDGITAGLYNYTLGRLDGCWLNSSILKEFRKKGQFLWPPAK
ncbi:MAG TPA: hypothetical protein PLG15_06480 [Candidatus Gastranaerophilaceae bacterium]|nr:hypothetical protein [Candidatus Gastranaerophilaceae bacterium]HPT42012.1 hypothetical protein [Candidatus Gastranaerophilaceae bacterium]